MEDHNQIHYILKTIRIFKEERGESAAEDEI